MALLEFCLRSRLRATKSLQWMMTLGLCCLEAMLLLEYCQHVKTFQPSWEMLLKLSSMHA